MVTELINPVKFYYSIAFVQERYEVEIM